MSRNRVSDRSGLALRSRLQATKNNGEAPYWTDRPRRRDEDPAAGGGVVCAAYPSICTTYVAVAPARLIQ